MIKFLNIRFLSFFIVFVLFIVTPSVFGTQASIEFRKKGIEFFQSREYARAVEEFTKAVEVDHDYLDAYYGRGLAYFEQHLYYKAIVDFDMVLMLNPDLAEAYYHRGLAYSRVNKLKLALADIKKAADMGYATAVNSLRSGEFTEQLEKETSRQTSIQFLLDDKRVEYGREITVTSLDNEFGGNTVMTTHSKGDPLFDGKEGVFRSIDYFSSSDVLVKTEVFHTYSFLSNNGRFKTVYWYNSDMRLSKIEYLLSGKDLTKKEVTFYDESGQPVKRVLIDRFDKEISTSF